MAKLNSDKLAWALADKGAQGLKNKELADICCVKVRRFLQLKAQYKKTGKIPQLSTKRRPQRILTAKEKSIIDKAHRESLLGATLLRLYISKHFKINIPHNKIHEYLLSKKLAKEEVGKKKPRPSSDKKKGRNLILPNDSIGSQSSFGHTGLLGHIDFHMSKCVPGKKVLVYIDDASKQIARGLEIEGDGSDKVIELVSHARKFYWNNYHTPLGAVYVNGSLLLENQKNSKTLQCLQDYLASRDIKLISAVQNNPHINCKNKRWFRTYEEHRSKFRTFDQFVAWYNSRVHGGLSRKAGITPDEAAHYKLKPESWLGMFFSGT